MVNYENKVLIGKDEVGSSNLPISSNIYPLFDKNSGYFVIYSQLFEQIQKLAKMTEGQKDRPKDRPCLKICISVRILVDESEYR